MNLITIADRDDGPVFGFNSVHFHARSDGPFGSTEQVSRLTGLAAVYEATSKRFQEHLVVEHVRETTWNDIVRGASRLTFNAALAEARAAQEAGARHMEPALAVDPMRAAEIRSGYRAVDAAGKASLLAGADLEALTAVVADGNPVPLDPTLHADAVRRYRVENRLVKEGVAAHHPAKPTVDNPLAIGADMDAARKQVEGFEAQHAARLAAVKANEDTARHLIAFLAAVYEVRPDEVLDSILGRDNAKAA